MKMNGTALSEEQIAIRAAEGDDVGRVLELWSAMMQRHEAFDPRIRLAEGAQAAYRAYLHYHLSHDESRLALAEMRTEEERRIIGFCLVTINRNLPMFLPPRYGYLSDLAVEDEHRRRGIGRRLAEDARRWLKEEGITSIQLQVYAKNDGAVQFWRSLKFESYYDRMWLNL